MQKRRYNYSNNFDLLVIRHEFLKNTRHVEESYIQKYDKVTRITSAAMYKKLFPNFQKVGFDHNDILSISRIYLVGYLANYGFRYHQQPVSRFVEKFTKTHSRAPNEDEIANAERNEIINFIRQKLQHCANVCARKARNITVGRDITKHFAKTADSQDVGEDLILENSGRTGYRKVTHKEFKEASKKAKSSKQRLKDENGYEIFTIQRLNNGIEPRDYLQIVESYDTIFTSNPESYLIKLEEQAQDELNFNKFNSLRQSHKIATLKKFIKAHSRDSSRTKETHSAKKLLRKYSFWYGY